MPVQRLDLIKLYWRRWSKRVSLPWTKGSGLWSPGTVGALSNSGRPGLDQRVAARHFTSLHLGIPFLNVGREEVQAEALELVPEHIARKYRVIPLSVENGVLTVAMEDPRNLEALEDLATVSLKRIEAFIATPQSIQEIIDRHYRVGGEIEKQISLIAAFGENEDSGGEADERLSAEVIAQAPVVRALDLLMAQAVQDRASDIHIEPQEDRLRIRFRTDGILREVMALSVSGACSASVQDQDHGGNEHRRAAPSPGWPDNLPHS